MKRTTIITAAFAVTLAAGGVGVAAAADAGPFAEDDTALTGEALDRAGEAALAETGGGEITDAETDDGAYEVEVRTDDGREVDVRLDEDFQVLGQETDDESDDAPLTGEALERATEAALAETGSGEVTDTESGDDGNAYEVEVTLDDGTEVDIALDEDFQVIAQETDDESDDD